MGSKDSFPYDLFNSNCEHYARWLLTGCPHSRQVCAASGAVAGGGAAARVGMGMSLATTTITTTVPSSGYLATVASWFGYSSTTTVVLTAPAFGAAAVAAGAAVAAAGVGVLIYKGVKWLTKWEGPWERLMLHAPDHEVLEMFADAC
jgi:hypothetical protein